MSKERPETESGQPPANPVAGADHSYFQAIESTFIELRGAPLLLSPADWQVAQSWHQQGISLRLVESTLREIFEHRQAVPQDKVLTLRFCRSAVEKAFKREQELSLGADRQTTVPGLDLAQILGRLADSLPDQMADLSWRLRQLEGDAEHLEKQLGDLDHELMERASSLLDEDSRQQLDAALAESLASLGRRLSRAELEQAAPRLRNSLLRRQLELPILSLFSLPDSE